jgi:hypothetical protein
VNGHAASIAERSSVQTGTTEVGAVALSRAAAVMHSALGNLTAEFSESVANLLHGAPVSISLKDQLPCFPNISVPLLCEWRAANNHRARKSPFRLVDPQTFFPTTVDVEDGSKVPYFPYLSFQR